MEEIRIGSHVLQPHRQLMRDGAHVHLGPRALAILTVLAEAAGEIVTKDELMEAVWPNVTVEENALQVHVAALRKALGEDASLLQTIRGIGYQVVQPDAPEHAVSSDSGSQPEPAPATSPRSSKSLHMAAIAALAVLVTAGVFWLASAFGSWGQSPSAGAAPQRIAVLPFDITGPADLRDRAEPMAASIAGNLSQLPDIELASDTATAAVVGQGLDPTQIADRLGVDHFIEGDVQAGEERLVGQLRLVDGRTGQAVWSTEVLGEPQYADEFGAVMLNRIAGIIVAYQAIGKGEVKLPDDLDPRARRAFMDGLALSSPTNFNDTAAALSKFQLAASIEPEFADAHAGIAYILAVGTNHSFSITPEDYSDLLQSSLDRAEALDPQSFLLRLARGFAVLHTLGDVGTGLQIAESLLEENPQSGRAHGLTALAQRYAGNGRAALEHIDQAIAADPFNKTLENARRRILIENGDHLAAGQSARDCRIDCWRAGLEWWEALSRDGEPFHFYQSIDSIAELYEDDRAYGAGSATRTESLIAHGRYIFRGDPNPFMQDYVDTGGTGGISHWVLMLWEYGFIDAGFDISMRTLEYAPASVILTFLDDHRLAPEEEIRADPRYHAIFDIPRFKAVADYRREQGLTTGLPVFPVQPYEED